MTTLSAAVPSQEGLSHYLAHGGYDKHLRQLRHALATQQALSLTAVSRHFPNSTKVNRPEGGYFLWLELPAAVNALQLHQLALSQNISQGLVAQGVSTHRCGRAGAESQCRELLCRRRAGGVFAAHSACFTMALSLILGEAQLRAEQPSTTARVTLEQVEGGFAINAVHLTLTAKVPGADQATFEAPAEKANAGCSVSKVLNA